MLLRRASPRIAKHRRTSPRISKHRSKRPWLAEELRSDYAAASSLGGRTRQGALGKALVNLRAGVHLVSCARAHSAPLGRRRYTDQVAYRVYISSTRRGHRERYGGRRTDTRRESVLMLVPLTERTKLARRSRTSSS